MVITLFAFWMWNNEFKLRNAILLTHHLAMTQTTKNKLYLSINQFANLSFLCHSKKKFKRAIFLWNFLNFLSVLEKIKNIIKERWYDHRLKQDEKRKKNILNGIQFKSCRNEWDLRGTHMFNVSNSKYFKYSKDGGIKKKITFQFVKMFLWHAY